MIVPLGGGGLLSGMSIAARALNPDIRIIGVEPQLADDAAESLRTGRIVPQRPPRTIADGLRTSLGTLTFPIIQQNVDEVVSVSDEAIVRAMHLIWERAKLVVAPSAVVGVAAVFQEDFKARAGMERTAVVLSGGNLDLSALPW